jgi:hypothetical protein
MLTDATHTWRPGLKTHVRFVHALPGACRECGTVGSLVRRGHDRMGVIIYSRCTACDARDRHHPLAEIILLPSGEPYLAPYTKKESFVLSPAAPDARQ